MGRAVCRLGERIAFNYLVSQKYTGEQAELQVLRQGRPLTLAITLPRPAALVPLHLHGRDPSFFVVAGGDPLRCCLTMPLRSKGSATALAAMTAPQSQNLGVIRHAELRLQPMKGRSCAAADGSIRWILL